jgi:hypothetical protein
MQGGVYHQTLAVFRDYEDKAAKQIIGDEYESTGIFRPNDGLQISNLAQGAASTMHMGIESSARAGEIYVSCVSFVLAEDLKREFGAVAGVEIRDPLRYIRRWIASLPTNAKHFAREVEYYSREQVPDNIWPQPELIATTKLDRFAYQQEDRFGFSTIGALDFEQVPPRRSSPVESRGS